MTYLKWMMESEPLRLRVYSALVALLPMLVAFGVDLTDAQSAAVTALAYVLLIGVTESARSRVTPTT